MSESAALPPYSPSSGSGALGYLIDSAFNLLLRAIACCRVCTCRQHSIGKLIIFIFCSVEGLEHSIKSTGCDQIFGVVNSAGTSIELR